MEKSHEKKEYILAGLSERGRLVGVPQQRRVEAVFSTERSASQWNRKVTSIVYCGVCRR